MNEETETLVDSKLKVLMEEWNKLNDIERWTALTIDPFAFKHFKVNLDNDETFVSLLDPKNEFQEEFFLNFNEYIGWSDGIVSLLEAINIKSEQV